VPIGNAIVSAPLPAAHPLTAVSVLAAWIAVELVVRRVDGDGRRLHADRPGEQDHPREDQRCARQLSVPWAKS
jgi:hypothetical protein